MIKDAPFWWGYLLREKKHKSTRYRYTLAKSSRVLMVAMAIRVKTSPAIYNWNN